MSGWISVKDRLPETGQRVLVYVPLDELYTVNIDKVYSQCKNDPWESFLANHVSHWQPLPPPPGAEDNSDVQAAINKAECV